jgi:hypothetical protein
MLSFLTIVLPGSSLIVHELSVGLSVSANYKLFNSKLKAPSKVTDLDRFSKNQIYPFP